MFTNRVLGDLSMLRSGVVLLSYQLLIILFISTPVVPVHFTNSSYPRKTIKLYIVTLIDLKGEPSIKPHPHTLIKLCALTWDGCLENVTFSYPK